MKTTDEIIDRRNNCKYPVTHILNPAFKYSRGTDLAKRFAEVKAMQEKKK